MTPEETEVAIIGGGLSGLAIARGLHASGIDFALLEGRDRVGGRILSQPGPRGGHFDLGPTWIWPHNRRMLTLAHALGLPLEQQYATGNLVFEDAGGHIRRDHAFSTMGDALRLSGGLAQLTHALANALPDDALRLSQPVVRVTVHASGVQLETASGRQIAARNLVLALPPRLWSTNIAFYPAPDPDLLRALAAVPTWMAGHTKVVAVYENAFWREAGLSGDAISHRGPLAEIHDATDDSTGLPALFGFVGVSNRREIGARAVAQLTRLFGSQAAHPACVLVKDWACDPMTAVPADADMPKTHPQYHLSPELNIWAGARIHVAGTESAPIEGGFLEGALEAAETVLNTLTHGR